MGRKLIDSMFSKFQDLCQWYKNILNLKTKAKIKAFLKFYNGYLNTENNYSLLPLKNFTKNDIYYFARQLNIKVFKNITAETLKEKFGLNMPEKNNIFCISILESQKTESHLILIKPDSIDFPWIFGKNQNPTSSINSTSQNPENEKIKSASKYSLTFDPNNVFYSLEYIFDKNQNPDSYIIFKT